MPPQLAD